MISIPIWTFVILCICAVVLLIGVTCIIVDVITEHIYQQHEIQKHKNKEPKD